MKREELKIYENQTVTDTVRTTVSPWKELNKDQRTLYHYLGNTIHSIKRDIASEGKELLRRFHASLLPEYEPEYIYKSKKEITLQNLRSIKAPKGYEYIGYLEYFFADNFNNIELIEKLELPINEKIISIDQLNDTDIVYLNVDGDIVTYNTSIKRIVNRTIAPFKTQNIEKKEFFNARYGFINGPIKIINVRNYLNESLEFEIKEITNTSKYQQRMDINNNGVVDEDDLLSFENVVGINSNQIESSIWNRDYSKFDLKKNGSIDEQDILMVEGSLWSGKEIGTLIILPKEEIGFTIEYYELNTPQPNILKIENGEIFTKNFNTFGSEILKNKYQNSIGINGLVETSTSPVQVEIDIKRNINFVKTDGIIIDKEKLSYKDMDKYEPIFIYSIDDVLFILTQHRINKSTRIYLVDLLNMAIEYTDDYFDIDITDNILGFGSFLTNSELLIITQNSIGTIFLNKYKLDKLYYTVNQEERAFYSTKSADFYIENEQLSSDPPGIDIENTKVEEPNILEKLELYPVKIQNSIDDFGFNWGIERLPGETNRELKLRILDFWVHLQGNDKTGMIYGISKNLGVKPEDLNFIAPTTSFNIQIKNRWAEEQPFKFLIIDFENLNYDLFSFKYFENQSTLFNQKFIFTGLYRITSESIEIDENILTMDPLFPFNDYDETLYTIGDNMWNFSGELISETDKIILDGNIINFESCPFFTEKYSEKDVYIYYDAFDLDGHIHYTNKDILKFPYFQNIEGKNKSVVRIENLMESGDFRKEIIENEKNREDFIQKMKDESSSFWKNAYADTGLYNTFSATPFLVKDNIWSGLNFNKHFDTTNSKPWRENG